MTFGGLIQVPLYDLVLELEKYIFLGQLNPNETVDIAKNTLLYLVFTERCMHITKKNKRRKKKCLSKHLRL